MNKTLKELSEFLGGKLHGNGNIIISGVGDLESAKEGQISFIKDKTYLEKSKSSKEDASISCEVTPHHLLLNEKILKKIGNFGKKGEMLGTLV